MKFILLSVLLLLNSGCASIIIASLNNKLPIRSAKSLKVTANIAAVGGGSLEVKNVTTDPKTGAVTAGEYKQAVNTGGGSVLIEGEDVELRAP